MKAKLKFNQQDYFVGSLTLFFLFLFAALLAYIKIFPLTKAEFEWTCTTIPSPNCLLWFETTRPYFQKIMIFFLVASGFSLLVSLFYYSKLRHK
jgi:hypothetical protein